MAPKHLAHPGARAARAQGRGSDCSLLAGQPVAVGLFPQVGAIPREGRTARSLRGTGTLGFSLTLTCSFAERSLPLVPGTRTASVALSTK